MITFRQKCYKMNTANLTSNNNMTKKLIFALVACLLMTTLHGQSWRKLRKEAEQQFEQGNYAEAAENYAAAWEKKQKREELIYRAGEAYYLIRDYREAAQAYQRAMDAEYDDDPLLGLKYARALKQDGEYEEAIQAFREFSQNYTGQGKAILEEIIRTEIRGAELARSLAGQVDPDIEISHLGSGVNSDDKEFGPLPFSNNVLYFSSTMGGKARIYRSQKLEGRWQKAAIPENFPVIQGDHFAHGALTPDGSRFYFTICGSEGNFDNLKTRCEIYVIKRLSGTWSQPERLPNSINQDGTTSTQPFVVHQSGTEYLYFSSNRGGGRGGLDLWYTTRSLSTDNNNFSNPVNLGPTINTLGDEMSPFIDAGSSILYFASNGHTSVGGFDIFSSQGSATSWSIPENIGLPFNSSADDYYYVQKDDGTGGFFASNRIFAGEKLTTRHDDIFEFSTQRFQPILQASVFDRQTNQMLNNYTVTVYEIGANNQESLLFNRPFNEGTYSFELPPGGSYRVEVASPGYEPETYTVYANDPSVEVYGQSVFLENTGSDISEEPVYEEPEMPTEEPPVTNESGRRLLDPGGEIYTSRSMAPGDQYEFTTTAPRYAGTYYKVQFIALRKYNKNADTFPKVRPLGENLTTEYIIERNLNRLMIGPYFTEEAARLALQQVHDVGYPKAFLVRYEDGQRYGRVR